MFRGTRVTNLSDILTDANALLINGPPFPGLVHKGFYQTYMSCRDPIQRSVSDLWSAMGDIKKAVFVTGHSLGAALATLCAWDLRDYGSVMYNYESPRVGDVDFARTFNQRLANQISTVAMTSRSWRVGRKNDPITGLPPEGDFVGAMMGDAKAAKRAALNVIPVVGDDIARVVAGPQRGYKHVENYHQLAGMSHSMGGVRDEAKKAGASRRNGIEMRP